MSYKNGGSRNNNRSNYGSPESRFYSEKKYAKISYGGTSLEIGQQRDYYNRRNKSNSRNSYDYYEDNNYYSACSSSKSGNNRKYGELVDVAKGSMEYVRETARILGVDLPY